MIKLKTKEEIELMRESALLVSKTLGMLAPEIKPGVTTLYLDTLAETFIRDHQAVPGFLGLYEFPNSLCISVNEQVVHGIPNNKPLIEGDIVSIDWATSRLISSRVTPVFCSACSINPSMLLIFSSS